MYQFSAGNQKIFQGYKRDPVYQHAFNKYFNHYESEFRRHDEEQRRREEEQRRKIEREIEELRVYDRPVRRTNLSLVYGGKKYEIDDDVIEIPRKRSDPVLISSDSSDSVQYISPPRVLVDKKPAQIRIADLKQRYYSLSSDEPSEKTHKPVVYENIPVITSDGQVSRKDSPEKPIPKPKSEYVIIFQQEIRSNHDIQSGGLVVDWGHLESLTETQVEIKRKLREKQHYYLGKIGGGVLYTVSRRMNFAEFEAEQAKYRFFVALPKKGARKISKWKTGQVEALLPGSRVHLSMNGKTYFISRGVGINDDAFKAYRNSIYLIDENTYHELNKKIHESKSKPRSEKKTKLPGKDRSKKRGDAKNASKTRKAVSDVMSDMLDDIEKTISKTTDNPPETEAPQSPAPLPTGKIGKFDADEIVEYTNEKKDEYRGNVTAYDEKKGTYTFRYIVHGNVVEVENVKEGDLQVF